MKTMHDSDKDSERWWIEAIAERQREKWPLEENPFSPGYQRRSRVDWYLIGMKLADIQEEYDDCDEYYPRHLVQRALMVIWPMLMPYTSPSTRQLPRREIMEAREQVTPLLLAMSMMAGKKAVASAGFDLPRITVRKRKKPERIASSLKRDADQSRQWSHADRERYHCLLLVEPWVPR